MYQGKPLLKKIKKINPHNPTLTSFGMQGVFYQPSAPPIVRDQLRYDVGFKDALQKTMEQQQFKRKSYSNPPKDYQSQQPQKSNYQPLRMRYKGDVASKITQVNMQKVVSDMNFKGSSAIRHKQYHGYDIIKNF